MGDPPGAVQAMARAADSTFRSDETSRRTLQDRRRRVWRLVRIAHAWLLLRERGFVRALRRTTGADAGLILAGGLIRVGARRRRVGSPRVVPRQRRRGGVRPY